MINADTSIRHDQTSRSKTAGGNMDALSDVLNSLHLSSSFYCRSEFASPWGFRIASGTVAGFHAVRTGSCWIRMDGQKKFTHLAAGDLVVFPHGAGHTLVDDPASPVRDLMEIIAECAPEPTRPLVYGGAGARVVLLCGHFQFEHGRVHPLLSVLPRMLHVRGQDGRAADWLESTLSVLARESAGGQPGAEAVITRATDILFIQSVRAYLAEIDAVAGGGWLRGLRDPNICSALALIHRHPGRPWTVEALAAEAGMSRSAFCAQFRRLVGESPHQYLTRWRMHNAASLVRDGRLSLAQVAERVGYQAEAAFSRAFKRHVGAAPGAYRRQGRSEVHARA